MKIANLQILVAILLVGCAGTQKRTRVAPSTAGVTSSIERSKGAVGKAIIASHRTSGHIGTARSLSERISFKAQILLER